MVVWYGQATARGPSVGLGLMFGQQVTHVIGRKGDCGDCRDPLYFSGKGGTVVPAALRGAKLPQSKVFL